MKFIGWRRKTDEMVAHYYIEHDETDTDAISLCLKFYGTREYLAFPGPGMFFCSKCTKKAEELNDKIHAQMFDSGN